MTGDKEKLLNEWNELITKCRHVNKFLLKNYKGKRRWGEGKRQRTMAVFHLLHFDIFLYLGIDALGHINFMIAYILHPSCFVRFEHSVCCGSLMTTYISIYLYLYLSIYIYISISIYLSIYLSIYNVYIIYIYYMCCNHSQVKCSMP